MRKNLLFFLMAMLLPFMASAYNHAITFSSGLSGSAGDRVLIPYSALNPTSDPYEGSWSAGLWVRQTALNNGGVVMAYTTQSHDNDNGAIVLQSKIGNIQLTGWGIEKYYGSRPIESGVAMPLNEWHFLGVTVDNTNAKITLYLDETPIIEQALNDKFPLFTTASGEKDGAFTLGGWAYLGAIDDLFLANRALSADEMKAAAKNPMQVNGLTAFYDFDAVIDGTTGQFANLAPGAYSSVNATYNSVSGSDWSNGLANVSESEKAPDLTTITEDLARVTTLSFAVPANTDFEHLDMLGFVIGENGLEAGTTVEGIEPGTEVSFGATTAAGYVIAGLTVDGVAASIQGEGGEYMGSFVINSNLTKDSFVFNITRTPYALTLAEAENGTFTVSANGEALKSGDMVPAGTELTLAAEAADGYKLVQFTLNGQPVEGTTVAMPEEAATIAATFTAIDYCKPEGNINRTDRYVSNIIINNGHDDAQTVAGPGSAYGHALYADRMSTVVTCLPGDVLNFSVNGNGDWVHTYIYADFDKNGWDWAPASLENKVAHGDLKWFNCIVIKDESGADAWIGNSDGEALESAGTSTTSAQGRVVVPADLQPGDYRVRYKTDWSCFDPCGNTASDNLITTNGGAIIDFTLRVESLYYDAERTITVATDNEEAGSVAIIAPATEGLSLTTALKNVTVKATAAEGAEFQGWYNGEELVSEAAEYTYNGTEDITLTAHFAWTASYTVTINQPETGGTIKVMNGTEEVASGAELLARTELIIVAEATEGFRLVNYVVNDTETLNAKVVLTENTVISAVFEEGAIEYCDHTGTNVHSSRILTGITASVEGANSVEIPGQTSDNKKIFQDHTDIVVSVEPGQTINMTSAGSGTWMQTYVYVDFDKNGWNVDPTLNTPNGDLVWFNAYSPQCFAAGNPGGGESNYNDGRDSDGNTISGNGFACAYSGVNSKIVVPASTAPGFYRVRYKVDWNCVDPCGSTIAGNLIANNGGIIIDFMIQVESGLLDAPRNITVAVADGQAEMGSVAITNPETEGNTVNTDVKNVAIAATPVEGAQFLYWTKDGEKVSEEAEMIVNDATDATYVANFGWTVTYIQPENGTLTLREDGSTTNIASGTAFAPGTKINIIATPDQDLMVKEILINGEKAEVTDNTASFIVEGATEISATFIGALYAYTAEVTGNGRVELWSSINDDTFAPEGEQYEEGVASFGGTDTPVLFFIPGNDGAGNYETLTAATITCGTMQPLYLEDLWECTYDSHVLTTHYITPIDGDIKVQAIFSEDYAGITDIIFDAANGPVEYYNLQGVRVDSENLAPGIYVARQGKLVKKVYIFAK